MSYSVAELARIDSWDARLLAAADGIKVLGRLSWPLEVQQEFLVAWKRGQAVLPRPIYEGESLAPAIEQLGKLVAEIDRDAGPAERFLHDTAHSYLLVCQLIEQAGKPQMFPLSRALYGEASEPLSSGVSKLEAAQHFLDVSSGFHQQGVSDEPELCVDAQMLKRDMEARLVEVFTPGTIEIVVDPHMASKAAAGATRIRLREGTCFSVYDLEQLLQHEAFIHSLTALNGKAQPHLRSLGLGAPRTTGAQEGLATFAELVTGSIDIARTERIALRVLAVDMAINGADFLDVFAFFRERQNSEVESFNSAMRIFRGAPLTGGYAFTKDVVYLHGLMEVHTFFRWAMLHERLSLTRLFFAGRMTIDDIVSLVPLFEDGTLGPPHYLPPWMTRVNGLAGYLAFSVFANRIPMDALDPEHKFSRQFSLEIDEGL